MDLSQHCSCPNTVRHGESWGLGSAVAGLKIVWLARGLGGDGGAASGVAFLNATSSSLLAPTNGSGLQDWTCRTDELIWGVRWTRRLSTGSAFIGGGVKYLCYRECYGVDNGW